MNVFLSYTRNKDQFLKVSEFRKRFEAELAIRVPGSRVFQDTHNIAEGAHFPEVIEKELCVANVLIILMSPAWLQSSWCRSEYFAFTQSGQNPGRLHRILPVLWVDTPELSEASSDEIARQLSLINYADWRDLRYNSWDDPTNQKQVGKLAERTIALANQEKSKVSPARLSVAELLTGLSENCTKARALQIEDELFHLLDGDVDRLLLNANQYVASAREAIAVVGGRMLHSGLKDERLVDLLRRLSADPDKWVRKKASNGLRLSGY